MDQHISEISCLQPQVSCDTNNIVHHDAGSTSSQLPVMHARRGLGSGRQASTEAAWCHEIPQKGITTPRPTCATNNIQFEINYAQTNAPTASHLTNRRDTTTRAREETRPNHVGAARGFDLTVWRARDHRHAISCWQILGGIQESRSWHCVRANVRCPSLYLPIAGYLRVHRSLSVSRDADFTLPGVSRDGFVRMCDVPPLRAEAAKCSKPRVMMAG